MADTLNGILQGSSSTHMKATLLSPVTILESNDIIISSIPSKNGTDAFSTGGAYELFEDLQLEINRAKSEEQSLRSKIDSIESVEIDLSSYITSTQASELISISINSQVPELINNAIENLNIDQYITEEELNSRITDLENSFEDNFLTKSDLTEELVKLNLVSEDTFNSAFNELQNTLSTLNTEVDEIQNVIDTGLVTKDYVDKIVGDINSILDEINGDV